MEDVVKPLSELNDFVSSLVQDLAVPELSANRFTPGGLLLKLQHAQYTGASLKVLDGIRAPNLSRFIFGPFCTQMLGDRGPVSASVQPKRVALTTRSRASGTRGSLRERCAQAITCWLK